ncbi:hypothetical protein HYALB_00011488 [Hymenoscyphus albidus]|uniref:Uncharacterized protein n=1 Tax=Hymenoscyphus albidus TaxID=595503 RepID=A0A9N9LTB7_9HELO|nr:hypothetical protein HYALB_00011488 [Hymenoscyphus albidus]
MAYPTPPPTSSPKEDTHHDYRTTQDFRSYDTPQQTPALTRIPAQEAYYHAGSEPSSPRQSYTKPYQAQGNGGNGPEQRLVRSNTDSPKHFYGPPHAQKLNDLGVTGRNQRPVDGTYTIRSGSRSPPLHHDNSDHPTRPSSGQRRRTPPPRPLYFSPTNRPPSPYNVSRPQPRPGFMKRMKDKVSYWMRKLLDWAKRNPIKAGLASIVPLVLGAGMIRIITELSSVAKTLLNKLEMGMGGGRPGQKRKPPVKEGWDWGLQHFVGFGGTKGGPLDGIMKILQMFMNHYARLTPSAVPRAACILLELYFLEKVY